MPRRSKNIRKPVPRPKDTRLPRAQAIAAMAHPDCFDDVDGFATCKALEGFSPEDRISMIEEANAAIGQRQYEQRLRTGRLKLVDHNYPLCMWPELFDETPELEAELTPEQAAKLAAARADEAERIERQRAAADWQEPLKFPGRKN